MRSSRAPRKYDKAHTVKDKFSIQVQNCELQLGGRGGTARVPLFGTEGREFRRSQAASPGPWPSLWHLQCLSDRPGRMPLDQRWGQAAGGHTSPGVPRGPRPRRSAPPGLTNPRGTGPAAGIPGPPRGHPGARRLLPAPLARACTPGTTVPGIQLREHRAEINGAEAALHGSGPGRHRSPPGC